MDRLNRAKVIETKRKPSLWSVKVGARYVAHFTGKDARARAEQYAKAYYGEFELVEKPVPKRERLRLDARAGLSDSTLPDPS